MKIKKTCAYHKKYPNRKWGGCSCSVLTFTGEKNMPSWLLMKTIAKWAGLTEVEPESHIYRCDECGHQFRSTDDPQEHHLAKCHWCEAGTYLVE